MTYKDILDTYFKPIAFKIRPVHPDIMSFSDPCNREGLIKRVTKDLLSFDPIKEAEDRFDDYIESQDEEDKISECSLFYPHWIECLQESVEVCMKEDLKIQFEFKFKAYLYRLSLLV